MNSFVVNVVMWILIWPEFVLSIDSVETDVRCVALTVWEPSDLTFSVRSIAILIGAY